MGRIIKALILGWIGKKIYDRVSAEDQPPDQEREKPRAREAGGEPHPSQGGASQAGACRLTIVAPRISGGLCAAAGMCKSGRSRTPAS